MNQIMRIDYEKQAGMSYVEVLVGALITGLFSAASLQSLLGATALKILAKQTHEADRWIQQDIESIKALSTDISRVQYSETELLTDAAINDQTIRVLYNPNEIFRVGDSVAIGTTLEENFVTAISTPLTDASSGNQYIELSLSQPITSFHSAGERGRVLPRCRSSVETGGYAQYLKDSLAPVESEAKNLSTPDIGTRTIGGKVLQIKRTSSIRSVFPHEILELGYEVTEQDNPNDILANRYTEMVPNAFFQCP